MKLEDLRNVFNEQQKYDVTLGFGRYATTQIFLSPQEILTNEDYENRIVVQIKVNKETGNVEIELQ